MKGAFEYVFPAIRGVQAGRSYYTSMCPLHLIPKIFLFDEEEVAPEIRAQRSLNRTRMPALTRYLVENKDSYVFSAITASIDGDLEFEPVGIGEGTQNIGMLHVPMSSRFLINDGQHRRAAIEQAISESPELGDESIAVVFFEDRGLKRAQQMFTDLNQHSVRPSRSLGLLYEHRTDRAWLAKEVANKTPIFKGRIEMEKSTLGRRSAKMFTLSAIDTATSVLLADCRDLPVEKQAQLAIEFWQGIAAYIPEWQLVQKKQLSGGEFRSDYICAHGLGLSALGHMGRALLISEPEFWKEKLSGLTSVDWSRSNELWEGRALRGGRLSKSHSHVRLSSAVLKRAVGVPLSPAEAETERESGFVPEESN